MGSKVWFGTANRMAWVSAPVPGVSRGISKWRGSKQYLNGGQWRRESASGSRMVQLQWPTMVGAEVRAITSFLEGTYGPGPFYYVDPFAQDTNMLPQWLAVPALACDDAPKLYGTAAPTQVTTPANTNAHPTFGAQYTTAGAGNSFVFPVPPNTTANFGWRGAVTGSASVNLTSQDIISLPDQPENLATNPSFEATGASVEVWRNYAWDPRATANSTTGTNRVGWSPSWYGTAGTGATSLVTGAADGPLLADGLTRIATYMRKTWSTAPTSNASTAFDHTAGNDTNAGDTTKGLVVTPGQVWTISTWVRPSANRVTSYFIRAYWRDASFAYLSTQVGAYVTATAGQWARISATFIVPANAVRMSLRTDVTGNTSLWQPGDTLDGTGLLVEMYPTLRDFYDGVYSPDSDLTPSWTGTAGQSASVLRATVPTNVGSNNSGPAQSSQWSSTGTKSLRIIPNSNSNDTSVVVAGDTASLTGRGVTFIAGQTYTVIATMRMTAAQTGSIYGSARQIVMYWNNTAGWTGAGNAQSTQSANAGGTYEHRLTFTVPADAVWAYLRLYNGASVGNGDVWWDNLAIIEGAYTGNYEFELPPSTASVPPLSVSDARLTNYIYTAGPDGGWVTISTSGTGTLTAYSMHLSYGSAPVGAFVKGEGFTGLALDGDPQVTGYSAVTGVLDRQSVTANFAEVGAWQ